MKKGGVAWIVWTIFPMAILAVLLIVAFVWNGMSSWGDIRAYCSSAKIRILAPVGEYSTSIMLVNGIGQEVDLGRNGHELVMIPRGWSIFSQADSTGEYYLRATINGKKYSYLIQRFRAWDVYFIDITNTGVVTLSINGAMILAAPQERFITRTRDSLIEEIRAGKY